MYSTDIGTALYKIGQAGRWTRPLRSSTLRAVRRLNLAVLAVASTLLIASVAHADDVGVAGRAVSLSVNTQGSEKYASFHGSLGVRQADGRTQSYYWGGSTCPAQRLDERDVGLLAQALHAGGSLVRPTYRPGNGARRKRCLVAFELLAPPPDRTAHGA